MIPFALVGLAGSGKSSVTTYLAKEYDLTIVSTDKEFADICADLSHPVTQSYLHSFEKRFHYNYDVKILTSTAEMINCYGEKTFRDFEESAIIWMFQSGKMRNALPDLGGAAFMRSGTRQALQQAGITSVFIEASSDFIADNLFKDYMDCKKTGHIKRGNYFDCGQKAEQNNECVRTALKQFSENHRAARWSHYNQADTTVQVEQQDTIEQVAQKVECSVTQFNEKFRLRTA